MEPYAKKPRVAASGSSDSSKEAASSVAPHSKIGAVSQTAKPNAPASSQHGNAVSDRVTQFNADVLSWQETLERPRLPTRGKDSSPEEQALAVRLSKLRVAAKNGELSEEQQATLASISCTEDVFVFRSPIQQLAEDIKNWQSKTGLQRFPKQTADDEERKLAQHCENLIAPHIRNQVTPGRASLACSAREGYESLA